MSKLKTIFPALALLICSQMAQAQYSVANCTPADESISSVRLNLIIANQELLQLRSQTPNSRPLAVTVHQSETQGEVGKTIYSASNGQRIELENSVLKGESGTIVVAAKVFSCR